MEEIINIMRAERAQRQSRILEPTILDNILEKGKAAQQGEVRTWNGQKFKKQGGKWVPVTSPREKAPKPGGKDKSSKKDDEKGGSAKDSKKEPSGGGPEVSSQEKGQLRRIKKLLIEGDVDAANDLAADLGDDAKNVIPEEAWERMNERTSPTSKDVKDDVAAKTIMEDKKERFKKWVNNNKDMFDTGEHAHPDRSKAAKLLRAKAKGFVKGLKHEIEHIKEAGGALKKMIDGTKWSGLSHHEQKAMKKVGISLGLTAATMLATGGLSAFSHGFTATASHLGLHFIEHGILETAGLAAIFAKAVEGSDDMGEKDMDKALEKLSEAFFEWMENGDWSGMKDADIDNND